MRETIWAAREHELHLNQQAPNQSDKDQEKKERERKRERERERNKRLLLPCC